MASRRRKDPNKPPHIILSPEQRIEKFYSYLDLEGDCIIWKGTKVAGGGVFHFLGKPRSVVHIMFYLINEVFPPKGYRFVHLCKNNLCVKMEHLVLPY